MTKVAEEGEGKEVVGELIRIEKGEEVDEEETEENQ